MKYLKYIQFFYLIAGAFFLFEAVLKFKEGENFYLQLLLAALSIGMFFFRRHFYNKYKNNK